MNMNHENFPEYHLECCVLKFEYHFILCFFDVQLFESQSNTTILLSGNDFLIAYDDNLGSEFMFFVAS